MYNIDDGILYADGLDRYLYEAYDTGVKKLAKVNIDLPLHTKGDIIELSVTDKWGNSIYDIILISKWLLS